MSPVFQWPKSLKFSRQHMYLGKRAQEKQTSSLHLQNEECLLGFLKSTVMQMTLP
ncbi:rCG44458 [Rattus norvegicus]|uniref:RCG44458 n=1 Tax=Rattus norvegicus TaxID=10116 RepID=A6I551_RAT|nr:rCG44458 [Rattus norvegicus]